MKFHLAFVFLMKFHWPLYSDISFFVDHYQCGWGWRWYQISIVYCLFGIVSLRNMPMYYAMVFKGCKMIILAKNCDIFLIFAPNTDHVYTLEPH